ncbi:S-layer homology domain-containing protein [Psychrobacillus sp. FSL H8-0484]|uniref:S-layer homology domain-containing protein n=1 Tax=Psychrobacillus sp. FSL H8-0484 TaxID=2921390 RepID=UPI0030F91FF3
MRKQSRFLAGAVTVSLVATTVVPTAFAASFSDTKGSTHEEAIYALVKAGVINGYPDGTFKPNKTLVRSDVVKLIGKYLVSKGFKVPADYKTKSRFTDLTIKNTEDELLKYAALVKDNGILGGSDGKLLPKENMTREDMAIALVRLTNVVEKVDLGAYVANQKFTGDVKDLSAAKQSARAYITVLDYFDITNPKLDKFNPKDTTTRGQFATFLQRTVKLDLSAVKVKPIELTNFQATGVKALTVTFNKEVNPSTAKFTVKKGASTVDISSVEFSQDKKSAKLLLPINLTAGTYDVSVTGIGEITRSKSVTVMNEKVDSIVIPTNNAILNAVGNKVKVPYKVLNQYGEDITLNSTNLTVNSNVTGAGSDTIVKPSEGIVEITKATSSANFKLGDKISLTLLDTATSTSQSKSVTVSEKSKVDEVKITSVYNDIDAAATLNVDATYGDFHLVLKAFDQYGLEVPAQDIASDVVVAISDTSIIDVNSSVSSPIFTQLTIDGQKQTVLELKQPKNKKVGKATVSITSKSSGKIGKFEVTAAEGVKADTITLTAPTLVVAGEKTEVPFKVYGLDGREITNATTLNNANGVKVTTNDANLKASIENDPMTGKAKLVVTDTSNTTTDRQVLISATTANMKSATLVVTVKAKAEAKAIIATKGIETNLLVGGAFSLSKDTVLVNDQYGREIALSASNLATAETTANAGKYLIKVETTDDKVVLSSNKTISATNAVTVTGNKKGNNALKLTLQQVDAKGVAKTIDSSAYEMNLKVTDKANILAYELKNIEVIYDNPASTSTNNYARELVVYGITTDGNKVVVPKSDYTVIPGHNDLVYDATAGTLFVRGNKDIVDKDDKYIPVKVIVNAERQPFTLDQTVMITKAVPFANKIDLQTINSLTVRENILYVPGTTATVNISSADLKGALKIIDQYGEDISKTAADRIKLTATNLVNSDNDNVAPAVTGNGTNTLTFNGVERGDTFYLTYIVDGNTLTAQVIVD